jgi:hypothetical protein
MKTKVGIKKEMGPINAQIADWQLEGVYQHKLCCHRILSPLPFTPFLTAVHHLPQTLQMSEGMLCLHRPVSSSETAVGLQWGKLR